MTMDTSKPGFASVAFTNGYEFTQGSGYALPEYPFTVPPELTAAEPSATTALRRYPVVVIGAGITGLTLAAALAQYGVQTVLLDEDNTVGVKGASSRGICYAQKTLEIFKRLGIYERIAAKGIQWSVGRTFAGDDEVYAFDLRQQQTHSLSLEPPFINIQQFYIEGYLVERIMALNTDAGPQADGQPLVDLRWSNRVTALSQDGEAAAIDVDTPAGAYRLQAAHVVDCTGSRSPVREWVGATATRRRGDDRWCIADVRFKDTPPVERHTWIQAPFNEGRAVWQHLMGDGVWRIDYQMPPDADPAEISREDVVRARLNAQFRRELSQEDCQIVWVGPYAYRSECLNAFRHGRVFFAGDAAHVFSPFGARGGNSGVQDADNLAWKLAAVLHGRAAEALLQSYHEERHEAGLHNMLTTNRTTRFLRPADGPERLFRDATLGLARQHAFARQLVNTGRMSTPNIYTQSNACDETGGHATQNVRLAWADGSQGELLDLLRWAGGRLLLLAFGPLSEVAAQALPALAMDADVRCVQVMASGERAQAAEHIRDVQGHVRSTCRLHAPESDLAWALLRPDGYLVATGTALDARLIHALERGLGTRDTTRAMVRGQTRIDR